MTRRARDLLFGVVLALVAFMGVLYQVAAATPADSSGVAKTPRLVCAFH